MLVSNECDYMFVKHTLYLSSAQVSEPDFKTMKVTYSPRENKYKSLSFYNFSVVSTIYVAICIIWHYNLGMVCTALLFR